MARKPALSRQRPIKGKRALVTGRDRVSAARLSLPIQRTKEVHHVAGYSAFNTRLTSRWHRAFRRDVQMDSNNRCCPFDRKYPYRLDEKSIRVG